jgi:hypothetical protein
MNGMPQHSFPPEEAEDINDTPTMQEYKKLKRVMRIMIKFYEDGSSAKLDQAEAMEYELQKVETDLRMVDAQFEALKPFPVHPKRTEYEKELLEERENLVRTRDRFKVKAEDFRKLYEWSLGIVDVTKWLFSGLDDYCVNHLKMDLDVTPTPLTKPSLEQFNKYKEGLNEVTYNLEESSDFFHASIDGRLRKYHQIEKDIVEAQLKAIEEFPPMNPRKAHIEEELTKDLEFVKDNMKETPEAMAKRTRMLSMHKDFLSVLKWYREKVSQWGREYGIAEKEISDEHKFAPNVQFMRNL